MRTKPMTQENNRPFVAIPVLLILASSLFLAEQSFAVSPKVLLTGKNLNNAEMINSEFQARIERELKIRKLQEYLLASGGKNKKEKEPQVKSSQATIKP